MEEEELGGREGVAARAEAGMVPVPVAAIIEGSACCNNHCIVSPSDL